MHDISAIFDDIASGDGDIGALIEELQGRGLSHTRIQGGISRAKSKFALVQLQAAAQAAADGNADECIRLQAKARKFVADEDEIAALVEEYRLSFRVQEPDPPASPVRHGFAVV